MGRHETLARRAALLRYLTMRWLGRPVSTGRYLAVFVPVWAAFAFECSSDVPLYLRLLLGVFAAVLPLLLIQGFGVTIEHRVTERRAERNQRSRRGMVYLWLALGWALAATATALAAAAAGARSTGPGAGEDWIATGLVWATMISVCAALMMAGSALTVRNEPR